jgi:large subunit ribosomal protein L25
MADIVLLAESGRLGGTRESRRLRTSGKIPAVVYGHGIEPIPVSVDARELRVALGGEAGSRALLSLRVGGSNHLAMARQLQRDPVRHTVIHVDFQVVGRDEVVTAEVPLLLIGEALAVHRGDGMVDQELQAVPIKAKPADLPPHLELDITEMEIGDSFRASELALPSGVELDVDPDTVVVIAHPPRTAELPEEGVAEGEVAAGEEGDGGAAGSAGGAGDDTSAGDR